MTADRIAELEQIYSRAYSTQSSGATKDGMPLGSLTKHQAALIAVVAELEAKLARYEVRLEIDHVFVSDGNGGLKRKEIPGVNRATVMDGITCRDETIKLLDQVNDELRKHVARYEQAAKELPEEPDDSPCYEESSRIHREWITYADKLRVAAVALKAENELLQFSWAGCSQQLKDAIEDLKDTEAALAAETESRNALEGDRTELQAKIGHLEHRLGIEKELNGRLTNTSMQVFDLKTQLATARQQAIEECAIRGRIAQLEGKLVDDEIRTLAKKDRAPTKCSAVRAVKGGTTEPSEFRWCSPCGKLLKDDDLCALAKKEST